MKCGFVGIRGDWVKAGVSTNPIEYYPTNPQKYSTTKQALIEFEEKNKKENRRPPKLI
jgi:hypothetical protein